MAHRVEHTVAMNRTDCILKWTVIMLYTDRAKILFRMWSIFCLEWYVQCHSTVVLVTICKA